MNRTLDSTFVISNNLSKCWSWTVPKGSWAAWSPLNREGAQNVRATKSPKASISKIEGLSIPSISVKRLKSLKPWLRTMLGWLKFELDMTAHKRTNAARQSWKNKTKQKHYKLEWVLAKGVLCNLKKFSILNGISKKKCRVTILSTIWE